MKAEAPKKTTEEGVNPEFNYGAELNRFETEIALCIRRGEEWLETHPEIVSFFNKGGLNGADYFMYKGIKVAPYGKAAEIEARNNFPLQEKLHGPNEGKVIGRS